MLLAMSNPKHPDKLFPMVVTEKLAETRAHYVGRLGFVATHDLPNYLQIRFGEDPLAPELAFLPHDTCASPPAFKGEGLVVSIPTADADAEHVRQKQAGVEVTSEPSDKPWGWRSFTSVDPNGVILDFFHVLADASGVDATG